MSYKMIPLPSKEILKSFPYYAYTYLIQHKQTKMLYIGVRFCSMENRYHFIADYDLRYYKTSSQNISFKRELDEYPDNFEYFILGIFKNHKKALQSENFYQNLYNVDENPLYYNFSKSKFILNSRSEEYFTLYKVINEIQIVSITKTYEEWTKVISHYNCNKFLLEKENLYMLDGYYKNFEYLYKYEIKIYTLYTIDNKTKEITEHKKTYREWLKILGSELTAGMICGKHKSSKGYFISKKYMIENQYKYDLITLYKYNSHKRRVEKFSRQYRHWNNSIGSNYTKLLNGSSRSVNGYYINYENCLNDNLFFTIKNIENNKTINILKKEGQSIVGKNFHRLISKENLNKLENNPICVKNHVLIPYNTLNYEDFQESYNTI